MGTMHRDGSRLWLLFTVAIITLLTLPARPARSCILDVSPSPASPTEPFVFPNWQRVEVAVFDTYWCSDTVCPGMLDATIRGVTLVNYGTALGGAAGDITSLYFCFACGQGANCTALRTLSYMGTWGGIPTWTWSGNYPLTDQPCKDCGCWETLRIFADIRDCPTVGATIRIGPRVDYINPGWPGGIYDAVNCAAPFGQVMDSNSRMIAYAAKQADLDTVSPGDTVNYTLYYGRPGNVDLTSIVIVDTQPSYTHYLPGTGMPLPDSGWDPNPGPPLVLRWTFFAPLPVAGGPTGSVRFSLSVDWGNGEAFEPGSGDVAAPEGFRLENRAHVLFNTTSCAPPSIVTPPASTVVRRFLFWKVGSNDILFSPTIGQPPDEMIYEIFLKNVSSSRTWWNVSVWDSVPQQIDAFCQGCGFEDACLGWTMTPNGCPATQLGWRTSGGSTILSWRLDMRPNMTISLRWKGKLKATSSAGETAVNLAGVLAMGRTNIVDGTGHSITPRYFTHLAPIVLPTTYVSYVGTAAGTNEGIPCFPLLITFFPLSTKTQFELRGIEYRASLPFAARGGVSDSIGCPIGDCIGGFPGNSGCSLGSGGISGGGTAGCRAERIPAVYEPSAWAGVCPPFAMNFIYKVTSNSPVLWQLLLRSEKETNDSETYAPSTSMSFSGMMHYMFKRSVPGSFPNAGEDLSMINTGMDAFGTVDATRQTTVHMFQFDYSTLGWEHRNTYDIAGESQVYDMGTPADEDGPWRTISSDTRLIVYLGLNTNSTRCDCGNDNSAYMPIRETGNQVSRVGSGTFYGIVFGKPATPQNVVVGNVGSADATYKIYKYVPDNMLAVFPLPPMLNGSSGSWIQVAVHDVPWGLATPGNPRWYNEYTPSFVNAHLYKVELISGGPIQVLAGGYVYHNVDGGTTMHAANGDQTGTEFWLHNVGPASFNCTSANGMDIQAMSVFCPKKGTVVSAVSGGGYTAAYTTTGPDQCVAFMKISDIATATGTNYRFTTAGGSALALWTTCFYRPRGYTAPFLQTGVHYQIITPPVVYSGQSFWITVVVLESGGSTKDDYSGITSFSSTDPAAKIEGSGMASYDYTWQAGDQGVRLFIKVEFTALGLQTIVGQDTLDGSITGLGTVMVVGADVKLSKEPRLTVASSGEAIQFRICWSNYSSATATNFTITDAVPMGTTYIPEAASLLFCGAGGPAIPTVTVAYGGPSATTPAVFNTLTSPTQTAPASTRWLRWTVGDVYVYSTGCVCFRVRVD